MKSVLWFVGGFLVTVIGGAGTTLPADQDPGRVRPPDRILQLQIEESIRAAEEAMRQIDLEQLQAQALERAELDLLFADFDLWQEEFELHDMEFALEDFEFDLEPIPGVAMKAAVTVATIGPIIIVYPFLQKHFMKGIYVGSLKG